MKEIDLDNVFVGLMLEVRESEIPGVQAAIVANCMC